MGLADNARAAATGVHELADALDRVAAKRQSVSASFDAALADAARRGQLEAFLDQVKKRVTG